MRKVMFEGRQQVLAHLCRELHIDRRTVVSRLDRGMGIREALLLPPRQYPTQTKRAQPEADSPPSCDPMIQDAIDILVDVREVLLALEPTPRRARILTGVRRWLRRAGWR